MFLHRSVYSSNCSQFAPFLLNAAHSFAYFAAASLASAEQTAASARLPVSMRLSVFRINMLVALMSTPDRWPSGSPHAQIKVIVVELAARARDRAGEAGHECRFAGEELVALVERLIDKITIPISVCSPRTRGDTTKATTQKELAYFNPLPSCEGRLADLSRSHYCFRFQSTPLMRGETTWEITRADIGDISIHSPHARGDENGVGTNGRPNNFNPLPSCEGRRTAPLFPRHRRDISIHSPHARGDLEDAIASMTATYFNPLPSCEGRRPLHPHGRCVGHFNPLPSCEGRLHGSTIF